MVLSLKKWEVTIINKTLYNLHVYIEQIEILHVFIYEWKYINVVNFGNFFLSELEEMKSFIYSVETANAECDCRSSGTICLYCCLSKLYFCLRESLQNTIGDKSLQSLSNAHPAYCCVASFWWQKSHGKIVRGKCTKVPILESRATIDYLLERNIIHFGYFFQQHQTCQLPPKTFVPPIQWVQ